MDKILPNKFIISILSLIILTPFLLYRSSFSAYFFQDDWFSLRISNAKTLNDFFSFFIPRSDVIYYRPLGMQTPFFVLQKIFGINPLPFRIVTFLTHAINVFLVFILLRLLSKHDGLALLSSFLYATSMAHYIPFFWFATYAFVLGPTFFFISFILSLLFFNKRKARFYIFSIGVFILGIFTNEMVFVLPLILFLYLFIFKQQSFLKFLVPYFLIEIPFFLFRFFIFPPETSGVYQLGLGSHILTNLKGYLLWSFNWPEEMKAQLVRFFIVNPQFIKDFPWYFFVFLVSLLVNIFLFYVIPLSIIVFKNNKKEEFSSLFFCLAWYIIGLLPVLIFPKHAFSYYLPISLVGLFFISINLFNYLFRIVRKHNKIFALLLLILTVTNWLIIAEVSFDFNSKVHWAPKRAERSRILTDEAKKFYPLNESEKYTIYVKPSSENKLAINDQDGFKVIYGRDDIVTVFGYSNNHYVLDGDF